MRPNHAGPGEVIARDDYFAYREYFDGVYFGLAHPNVKVCCNALLIDLGGVAVAVDSHSRVSAAEGVARFARSRGLEVGYLVNTHHHWDHSQGNAAYAALGARILAHPAAIDGMRNPGAKDFAVQREDVAAELAELRERPDPGDARRAAGDRRDLAELEQYAAELTILSRVVADEPVADAVELVGSRRRVCVAHPGPAHTSGDLIVQLPEDDAVATGDCVIAWTPFMGDAIPRRWIAALDQIAAGPAGTIFMGHGPVAGTGWLRTFQRYLQDLVAECVAQTVLAGTAEERAAVVRGRLADRYQAVFDRHGGRYRPWAKLMHRSAVTLLEQLTAEARAGTPAP